MIHVEKTNFCQVLKAKVTPVDSLKKLDMVCSLLMYHPLFCLYLLENMSLQETSLLKDFHLILVSFGILSLIFSLPHFCGGAGPKQQCS